MSVNGVSDVSGYQANAGVREAVKKSNAEAAEKKTNAAESEAAIYEKGDANPTKVYKTDIALVEKMKAEAEEKTAQLRSLVEKMMLKQGQTVSTAMDYIAALKSGTLEIDEATRKQAEEDISEDGYWGVEQTSDRLVSFAKALAGDDPSKAEKLMAAIEEGYKQATKAWGDELPDICSKTLEAARTKMDAWKNSTVTAESEATQA